MIDNEQVVEDVCGYTEEVSTTRFVYISFCGIVAVLGCFSNILLCYLFTTRKFRNSPPQLYPAFLSILDALLCFFFVIIFVVDCNMIYNKSQWLFVLFHQYIIVTFFAVKIVQFLIPYMLMLGTLERYTWIDNEKQLAILQPRFRRYILGGLLIGAVALRVPTVMALTISKYPDCPDFFRTLAVDSREWARDNQFYTLYDVYMIALLQTFCPFVTLMILNIVIVNKLAKLDAKESKIKSMPEHKFIVPFNHHMPEGLGIKPLPKRSIRVLSSLRLIKMPVQVRNAIYTMVAIVSTYLISNSLHIFLTLLEVTSSSLLKDSEDAYKASFLYTLLGDLVSIMYMTSSAIRIVIYTTCNPAVRDEIFKTLKLKKKENSIQSTPTSSEEIKEI